MTDTQKVPRRDEIPEQYRWDLTTIYPDDAAWERDIAAIEQMLGDVSALQGHVARSADDLLKALRLRDQVSMRLWQIYVYANRRFDSDTTDPVGQALAERAGTLAAKVSAALAFIDPEILAAPEDQIRAWLKEHPDLAVYEYALDQLLRQRAHVRSAEIEAILAQFSDITRAPGEIYEVLTNADLSFPTIEDEQGQQVQLSHGRFLRFLRSPDRRVRRDAFVGYYSAFQGIRNTLGASLAAQVRTHVVNARIRNYASSLEAALLPNDIPVEVYHNLIATVSANLPRLHRYLRLRRRIMGLDELHFYDLYAPLVPEADIAVPYDEAERLVRAAFEPLGEEYGAAVAEAFRSRWIDVYENVGKRSGAYSDGAYTTAPFMLLNYQGRLNDVFTLAHELGHAMHSYFTRKTQPYIYGDYTIFVAEVASTLNEALLTDYLLKTHDDPKLRRYLIVEQLEDIRTTLFRQTMFAEFELDIHRRAEAGEPLTAELFSTIYRDLVARYHGSEVALDEQIALEWARIPHFYYNFYVYQYATGLSAALALHKRIVNEGRPAIERYLRFLRSGSSRPSIELLRDAGVDMLSSLPIQAAMDHFDALLDELDRVEGSQV
ncbi:MAG: oligoendopeptidase F [Roseiflexus sp.]|nr:oligoendopeptidase F [Roseiflexus sp.]MDW8147176.1 oligoendopeptidase F [Roseiflexaceae bacterium]MDW8231576.1 oligoendopeptidase F [Roseiflexaceae bacterium]